MMKIKAFIFLLVFGSLYTNAQDIFVGKWSLQNQSKEKTNDISFSLQIGNPEKNFLYPAQIHITSSDFDGTYHLLLVKKNYRQLSISSNKFPINEAPVSIGNFTKGLNGTFDVEVDKKGVASCSINRIQYPQKKTKASSPLSPRPSITSFFSSENFVLQKISSQAWEDTTIYKILQPQKSPIYYGIIDTLFVSDKIMDVVFEKNKDNDIVSLRHNNNKLFDLIDIKKKRENQSFLLDTGLNLVTFFIDEFGKKDNSNPHIGLDFGVNKYTLDFNKTENQGASFIVAKIFYRVNEEDILTFDENTTRFNTIQIPKSYFEIKGDKSLKEREVKQIGNIITNSKNLSFAIWDDAVEDGDTISLSINGEWIKKGFAVKNKPQFITVQMNPGPNVITFIADNLGTIPPNTSVLEIIDGKKRKSFYIETDMNKNNQIKIFYEVK